MCVGSETIFYDKNIALQFTEVLHVSSTQLHELATCVYLLACTAAYADLVAPPAGLFSYWSIAARARAITEATYTEQGEWNHAGRGAGAVEAPEH